MESRAYDLYRVNRARRRHATLEGDLHMKRSRLATALATFAVLSTMPIVAQAKGELCALPSAANLRAWVGRDVHVAPEYLGKPQSGQCQWTEGGASGGGASVLVQVAPARYYEPHRGAPDFAKLHGIGERAYYQNDLGFVAGALKGRSTIVVSLSGGTANKARAIDALRFFVERL